MKKITKLNKRPSEGAQRINRKLWINTFNVLLVGSTHPIKIPNLPKIESKSKGMFIKKPPIDQPNHRTWASS